MHRSNFKDDFGWRSRGYLPHFDNGVESQFITTRLFDSMPKSVLARWEIELRAGTITDADLRRRVEEYLDSGYGSCYLANRDVAAMVCETLLLDAGVKYDLHAFVVMSNHMHFLISQIAPFSIGGIVKDIKSITAHRANRILGRSGRFWFPEPYDRYIRNERHFRSVVRYIEENPVKAGLCDSVGDWPFSSAFGAE